MNAMCSFNFPNGIRRNALALGLWLLLMGASGCDSVGSPDNTLPDPLEAGWRGESVCEALHDDNDVRVLRCIFPPGVGHERHVHAPHIGIVTQGGTMQITDASGVRDVETRTGAKWTSEGGEWHEVLNVGAQETSYLIIEPK